MQPIKIIIRKACKNQQGMTLVELMVGLAILSVVLAIGYSVYAFGSNTFNRGGARSDVRQNVRLAADFITEELRYATHVRVLGAIPSPGSFAPGGDLEGYKAAYVVNGSFKHINTSGTEESPFGTIDKKITLDDLSFSLIGGQLLQYEVRNKNVAGDDYSIASKLKFLNYPLIEPEDPLDPLLNTTGLAIAYKSETFIALLPIAFVDLADGTLPEATSGEMYSYTFLISGGMGPYEFALAGGSLSGGLTLAEDGDLTGTPTESGEFSFAVKVTDSKGTFAEKNFTLKVKKESSGGPVDFPEDFVDFVIEENVFVYGTQFNFSGGNVNGPGAAMVVKGGLNTDDTNLGAHIAASDIYIFGSVNLNKGSASLGSSVQPGHIYVDGNMVLGNGKRDVYGTVHVNGDFFLKDARIHGTIYVAGNVELDWTPEFLGEARIYYTGNLIYPPSMGSSIISKCIKVDSVPDFVMPDYEIPPTKPGDWFYSKGYLDAGVLNSNIKIFADSYTTTSWRPTAENVIIVAKNGNITLTGLGSSGVTGVLFAPNGKVTFDGGFFEGLVIARDGFDVTSGGTTVTFRDIKNYIDNPADYPF